MSCNVNAYNVSSVCYSFKSEINPNILMQQRLVIKDDVSCGYNIPIDDCACAYNLFDFYLANKRK